MAVGVIGRVSRELDRFLDRHILGVAPHPDHWPPPHDCSLLPVPAGCDVSDDTGGSWVLDHEHSSAWHHRRTAIGAQGYRFVRNGEFDCGWRLADVAARFVHERIDEQFDVLTILPPPPIHRSAQMLPWIAQRLADRLGVPHVPDLFMAIAPYAEHPDVARYLSTPASSLFVFSHETDTQLNGASVLLVDWVRHSGQTLRALAHQLKRRGATVVRFTWFDYSCRRLRTSPYCTR